MCHDIQRHSGEQPLNGQDGLTVAHLEKDWDHGAVPVIGNEDTILARSERQPSCGFDARLGEHAETLGVVHIVRSGLGAVQL
jgi:hypothetical protein